MKKTVLSPVIHIDEDKCISCHACITACPVKYCMDASGDIVKSNPDMCIGCGNCIAVCSHEARHYEDDTQRFLADVKQKTKMVAIVAPAIASFFNNKYLNLNGYLKSLGVEAIFDVSFAAELTVISYLNYIKEKNPRMVIAQPCPAIVTFIEIYHPELLPFLAPADSPMLHAIKMIREYFPQYKNYKIAVLSPCIAKRREFEETGLGDYNITMLSFQKYLESQHIDLSRYPATEYENPPAERAVQFSAPGGLLDTAERFVPGIRRRTRKIEGVPTIYHYLEEVSKLLKKPNITFPLLIDCLNCEKGCNGGPGTGNGKMYLDELESPIQKRCAELEAMYNPKERDKLHKKLHKMLNRFWKRGLYDRSYRDLSSHNNLKYPNDEQLKGIFARMRKYKESDMYDCTSCGYGTCKAMATAIFNSLNKPENCAHFNLALLEEDKKNIAEINQNLNDHIAQALKIIEGINGLVNELSESVGSQSSAVDNSSSVTGKMIGSLKGTSSIAMQKQESIKGLIINASKGQDSMRETIQSVQGISQSVDGIAAAIKIISGIAANTNLLAMNAAIEAAHAGDAGRGFAVVADEIRRLSETTRENSRNISQTLSSIIEGINVTSRCSSDTDSLINEMSDEINGVAGTMTELISTLSDLSNGSSEITNALETLRRHSTSVKNGYTNMLSMTERLRSEMEDLAKVSASKTV